MKLPKNKPSEKKLSKDRSNKSRKTVREDIYKLWQEEMVEEGFKQLNRLQQGLL